MGKGIAYEATKRFPELPKILGKKISTNGNNVHTLGIFGDYILLSFPVKPIISFTAQPVKHMIGKINPQEGIPGWACVADPTIIEKSTKELALLCNNLPTQVFLPRPGCGAGELT